MFLFGLNFGKEDLGVFGELLHANLDVERFIVAFMMVILGWGNS